MTGLPTAGRGVTDGPIRVLIVDDHAVVRAGLRVLLTGFPDLEVVGEAADGAAALAAVPGCQPHVVLMDLSMPGVDGVTATAGLAREHPELAFKPWPTG